MKVVMLGNDTKEEIEKRLQIVASWVANICVRCSSACGWCFKYLGINTKTSLLSGRNACDRYFQCLRLSFQAFGCPFLVLLSVGRMLMQSALARFDAF